MSSTISLVTVSYFSGDDVVTCLNSVPEASIRHLDIIVVNNAAADDLRPTLEQFEGPDSRTGDLTLLEPKANLGYGGAVNFAAARLAPEIEWILVTNPDVTFTPGSIDALLAVAEADDRIGMVGPRITNDDGSIYPSARDLPSLTVGAGHAVLHRIWPGNPWSKRYLRADKSHSAQTEPVQSGWLSGACMLVRRAAFEQVGGFDDRFFMYFEDVDLGERIGNAGWKVLYVPTATVGHAGGTSTAAHSAAMTRAHHRSAYRYLAKRYHQWYLLPVRLALRLGLFLRALVGTVRNHG
ncbi:glycosyltransferase family 2 protein [Subtercola frigoramans]|uniref:N-acetylglucosaminyl-diphospho-decaprenol L-rhamnosyltransferase n=1 Tax=Subtercola frigoramans TaxID=120298 RepID=A0ABS2L862_9MICO|nr:glycosyltransferase family 2 protein [Subtercola frigoramans]MBM7473290.1 N-acetylglucosaminyl-diphospho-decaprenol L-rhamnosyltransferase [Subtercola frigoramans]